MHVPVTVTANCSHTFPSSKVSTSPHFSPASPHHSITLSWPSQAINSDLMTNFSPRHRRDGSRGTGPLARRCASSVQNLETSVLTDLISCRQHDTNRQAL